MTTCRLLSLALRFSTLCHIHKEHTSRPIIEITWYHDNLSFLIARLGIMTWWVVDECMTCCRLVHCPCGYVSLCLEGCDVVLWHCVRHFEVYQGFFLPIHAGCMRILYGGQNRQRVEADNMFSDSKRDQSDRLSRFWFAGPGLWRDEMTFDEKKDEGQMKGRKKKTDTSNFYPRRRDWMPYKGNMTRWHWRG